jgi:holo-[acyl-carrier protein] synthase
MIIGIGVDILDLSRVRSMVVRLGADRVYRRLLTDAEREYCLRMQDPIVNVAARLAAKEAAFKALSGSVEARAIGWREMEVAHDEHRRPRLAFHGRAAERARELGVTRSYLTLSHGDTSAVAMVVLEGA